MREVVEVVKKDPGADLRRLSNREKTLLIDRLRPAYSLSSMTCLLAIAPSSYHYHHARLGVDKYAGLRAEVARSPIQGQVRVPQDQGGAQDRRIGEGGPQDHGGGRARGARAQATQV